MLSIDSPSFAKHNYLLLINKFLILSAVYKHVFILENKVVPVNSLGQRATTNISVHVIMSCLSYLTFKFL